MHMVTSLAPDIEQMIEENQCCAFTKHIASIQLQDIVSIWNLQYSRNSNLNAHVRAFCLAISRAHMIDEELVIVDFSLET